MFFLVLISAPLPISQLSLFLSRRVWDYWHSERWGLCCVGTYETTAFQGWRLNLSKRGTAFTKYYSDKQHGGQRKALKAANTARTELKERRQAWETQRTEAQGKVDKLYFEELEQLKKNFSAAVARVMKTLIGRAF